MPRGLGHYWWYVVFYGVVLASLQDLDGLTKFAGSLDIYGNTLLASMQGLDGVTITGGKLYFYG